MLINIHRLINTRQRVICVIHNVVRVWSIFSLLLFIDRALVILFRFGFLTTTKRRENFDDDRPCCFQLKKKRNKKIVKQT